MGPEETDVAVTVTENDIDRCAAKLSDALKHQGTIDVEMLRQGTEIYVLDINLRFGGSYAFSHVAGADIPAALVRWASGQQVRSDLLTHEIGVVGAKYSQVQRLYALS